MLSTKPFMMIVKARKISREVALFALFAMVKEKNEDDKACSNQRQNSMAALPSSISCP